MNATLSGVERAMIAASANRLARASRRPGTPVLRAESPREDVVAWLQWNDPNGAHADELAVMDRVPTYTLEGAWSALAEIIGEV